MTTIVYIDGYNLYYGLLRNSSYKWLNLVALFEDQVLRERSKTTKLIQLKYYTADVKARFARHGSQSQRAQQNYHRALETTGRVVIIKGDHSVDKATPYKYLNPPDLNQKVDIWKIEEKQTDVNIALDMYRDAVRGAADQLVLCSNDTDLMRALKYVREDCPAIILGLVAPLPKNGKHRPVSVSLSEHAHWTRKYIREEELKAAQFKHRIPTRKKPIDKPEYW